MKQTKLNPGKLLDENGNLNEAGYATSLVKEYNRSDIKAPKLRIKEWDYYYIGNNKFGLALTIDDNSYMGLMSVSVLDFENNHQVTKSPMSFMPKGKTNLPSTSKIGDVSYKNSNVEMAFLNDGKTRHLKCFMKNFYEGKDFNCDIVLDNEPKDSLVICTPFLKDKHFYYNQKINNLRARGTFSVGEKTYEFKEASYAVLDWGRGVWTYSNTWYWSSMSGEVDGVRIGFNLGYGFGDTSKASENILFYDGIGYKVDQVDFGIPKDGKQKDLFMEPWHFTSNDGKVDLVFIPVMDRYSKTDVIIIKSIQHQVFGKFSGKLIVDGKNIEIKDIMGFAEKVKNCW